MNDTCDKKNWHPDRRHYTTPMRAFIVILLAVVVLFGVLAVTPWGHDFIAVRTTRYAPGFSEQAFSSARVGDTREQIITAFGHLLHQGRILVGPTVGLAAFEEMEIRCATHLTLDVRWRK